jgi:hypothetical protein
VDEDGQELHNAYLVTLNGFNYIVNFSVAVEYPTIQYCAHRIGFDYEVSKLGFWEYNHLRNNIPTINIKTDANYVSNFWATTKLWHECSMTKAKCSSDVLSGSGIHSLAH